MSIISSLENCFNFDIVFYLFISSLYLDIEYKIEKYHKDIVNISQRLKQLVRKQERTSMFSLVKTSDRAVLLGLQVTKGRISEFT